MKLPEPKPDTDKLRADLVLALEHRYVSCTLLDMDNIARASAATLLARLVEDEIIRGALVEGNSEGDIDWSVLDED